MPLNAIVGFSSLLGDEEDGENVNGYGTGDLLVNVSVYVPETLNKDEKKALEEMEESDNFKPNTSIKEKIFKKFKSLFD